MEGLAGEPSTGTDVTPFYCFVVFFRVPRTLRHLPPNSARFSCATEGALSVSAQLSTDAVSALRKVRVLI